MLSFFAYIDNWEKGLKLSFLLPTMGKMFGSA